MQEQESQEKGVSLCRKSGHLKSKYYNTKQNRVEIRCPRCGRILGIGKGD